MKRAGKILPILAISVGVLAVLAAAAGILFQGTNEAAESWYVRIDNSMVSEITPHGGMSCRYVLTAYRENGASQTMNLDTSRVLRDGAFLRLSVAPVRGVISWEEVPYDGLPPAVAAKLQK